VLAVTAVLALMTGYIPQAHATSEFYKPDSDDEIIAELPADVVALAASVRELANETTGPTLREQPHQMRQIIDSYRLASNTNSARAYGHTLALLQSWPTHTEPPPMLRLIKADVLQHNHAFDQAAAELDQLLSIDPGNQFALQMKSQIHLVIGDYRLVQSLCEALASYGHRMSAHNCQAQLDGVSGAALPALTHVDSLLNSKALSRGEALELNITAAGLAHRLGEHDRAELYYTTAFRLSPSNDYVLVNYADWLLERDRAVDAASLLVSESGNANKFELQLVYLQALLLSDNQEEATGLLPEIRNTISIMEGRGEERPSKLLARYYLTIAHDFDRAHREALRNWQIQKEPSDSWMLARSAVAAERWDSLDQLLLWYRSTGQQDYRVDELIAQQGLSE